MICYISCESVYKHYPGIDNDIYVLSGSVNESEMN